jgi:hypothetical protein
MLVSLAALLGDCSEDGHEYRHVAQMGERYLDAVEVGGSIPPVPILFC